MDTPGTEQFTGVADIAVSHAVPALPPATFETRWAAWVARGQAHEKQVRRGFVVWGTVIAAATAIAYALLRT